MQCKRFSENKNHYLLKLLLIWECLLNEGAEWRGVREKEEETWEGAHPSYFISCGQWKCVCFYLCGRKTTSLLITVPPSFTLALTNNGHNYLTHWRGSSMHEVRGFFGEVLYPKLKVRFLLCFCVSIAWFMFGQIFQKLNKCCFFCRVQYLTKTACVLFCDLVWAGIEFVR